MLSRFDYIQISKQEDIVYTIPQHIHLFLRIIQALSYSQEISAPSEARFSTKFG